ncbi:MAG: prolyl oligopeptidase family serine peptidase [Pseudomonadota bacterium]
MRRVLLLSLLALPAALVRADAPTPSAPPAASLLFQAPEISNPTLSPDGRSLALISRSKGQRAGVLILDLDSMTARPFVRFDEGDVGQVFWVSDKRLAYTSVNVPKRVVSSTSGLYAMDTDRSNERGISPAMADQRSFLGVTRIGARDHGVDGLGAQNSDHLYVMTFYDEFETVPTRINTRTLRREDADVPRGSFAWLMDDKDGLRTALARERAGLAVHVRRDRKWDKLAAFEPLADQSFTPALYSASGMYVRGYQGGDRAAIYRYDLDKAAMDAAPLINSPAYDIDGEAITDDSKMIGYRLTLDAEETIWFDPALKALQKEIDTALPSTINRMSVPRRGVTPFVLVQAFSAMEPGRYYIYDRSSKKLSLFGRAHAGIDAARMADAAVEHYTTRDGRRVPVLLTFPRGAVKKDLPAVVLLATSPWRRNAVYGWNPEAQFLAARGYLVIQPDARGSEGYGRAHFKAGMRQWGLAIQDDIADSAKWAVSSGYADARRICIAGAFYGGYAALMGVLRDPDTFRCAVSMAGIVDIGMMFENDWQGVNPPATGYDLKALVGDPALHKAQLQATSPLAQAGRIKAPVLLAYGAQDTIVPLAHGRLLHAALKASSPGSEFHLYGEGEAAARPDQNLADLWEKVDKFLGRHIGPK